MKIINIIKSIFCKKKTKKKKCSKNVSTKSKDEVRYTKSGRAYILKKSKNGNTYYKYI